MNKHEKEMLNTIIGKLENLRTKTKNDRAKESLQNALNELLSIGRD